MENMVKNQNGEKQPEEKTFTQEDVNRIVQERLSREKSGTVSADRIQELEQREKQLDEAEKKLNEERLNHYMISNSFPVELLDILKFDGIEDLETKFNTLYQYRETFAQAYEKKNGIENTKPRFTKSTNGNYGQSQERDNVGEAFKLR